MSIKLFYWRSAVSSRGHRCDARHKWHAVGEPGPARGWVAGSRLPIRARTPAAGPGGAAPPAAISDRCLERMNFRPRHRQQQLISGWCDLDQGDARLFTRAKVGRYHSPNPDHYGYMSPHQRSDVPVAGQACPVRPHGPSLRHHDGIQARGFAEPSMWRPGLTQIRVHELASELNVSTQQVLSLLEDLGKKVRGPSTVIGVSDAAKVRARCRAPRTQAAVLEPLAEAVGSGRPSGPDAPGVLSQSLFLPPIAPVAAATIAPSNAAFANPFALPTAGAGHGPGPDERGQLAGTDPVAWRGQSSGTGAAGTCCGRTVRSLRGLGAAGDQRGGPAGLVGEWTSSDGS